MLLEPEDDEGNVEYKLRLKQPNPVRFQQLVCHCSKAVKIVLKFVGELLRNADSALSFTWPCPKQPFGLMNGGAWERQHAYCDCFSESKGVMCRSHRCNTGYQRAMENATTTLVGHYLGPSSPHFQQAYLVFWLYNVICLTHIFTTGVEDDGYPRGLTPQELEISHSTLKAMAVAVNATIQPLKEMTACKGRVYVIFRISRICLDHLSYTDLRIAGMYESQIGAP